MALIKPARVSETLTFSGTGNLSLTPTATTGCRTFASVATVGDTFFYVIQAVDGAATLNPTGEWECGVGTYSAANTITRTSITANSAGTTTALNFTSATVQVFIYDPDEQAGVTTVNFGANPGKSDVALAITGQTGIVASSIVNAWLVCTATADHSADEHAVEEIDVRAGNIVPGTGFTIYAKTRNEPLTGQWTVHWRWN